MPKMNTDELRAMLSAQKASALSSQTASFLSRERTDAIDYYMGDMSGDMPTVEGRSSAVSTDVADTVEGLMPLLMDIFVGGDEVVRFEPVGPEDDAAAQQETDYVNHVFMQQNPGFIVLYGFIKDALLEKTGIVKVFWEAKEDECRETYLDQSDDQLAILISDPNVEIVEHTPTPQEDGTTLHDITVVEKTATERAVVEGVPPEEFGFARNTRAMATCDYCFHKVIRTESDLIAQEYDSHQVKGLPDRTQVQSAESAARDSVLENSENQSASDVTNRATREIDVTEHYVRMDYDGSGKASLYKVTTAGDADTILIRDGKEDIDPVDMIPFAVMSPIIIPHRLVGRSIADLVMDIQRVKTALLRALLDNAYLANNPRVEVAQSHATETTLDDLLVSRPGGVVRTRQPGGINWQTVPTIGGHVYPLIEYMDATRAWRTGVTPQGQGIDANALQNQTATAVNQAFTVAQARMKLIARIFAETGIKDMFALLHATIRKNGSKAATVRLRNTWVQVDPQQWKSRNDLTINVGLGSGGKQQQLAGMMALIGLQKEALANGLTNMVGLDNLYNSAKEVTKLLGHKSVDQFFKDPATQPPPEEKPDPKVLELQAKAEIEKTQAEADIVTQNKKVESEMALAQQKFAFESQLKMAEHEMRMKEQKLEMLAKMSGQQGVDEFGNPVMVQSDSAMLAPLIMELIDALKVSNAPKRIVRDGAGKVSHIEPVAESITPTNGGDMPSMIAELAGQLQAAKSPKRIVRDPATGKVSHTETVTG